MVWVALILSAFAWGAAPGPDVSVSSRATEWLDSLEAYGCAYATSRLLGPRNFADLRDGVYVPDSEGLCLAPGWLLAERAQWFLPFYPNAASLTVLAQRNDATALKGTEASVMPLFPLWEGRPFVDGANLAGEFRFATSAGKAEGVGLALGATAGVRGSFEQYDRITAQGYLLSAYVRAGYGRTELTLGRRAFEVGDARHGNLLLGSSSPPLDSLELAVRPHLVGGLGFLGPLTLRLWWGRLGPSAFVDESQGAGLAVALRPALWLELGWAQFYQFGGSGVPSLEASDLPKLFIFSGDASLNARRRRAGVLLLTLREPKGFAKLYLQGYVEGAVGQWSWLAGFFLPRVGKADFRLEGVVTSADAYTDPTWRQGHSRNGFPLGHPLGPDALGIYGDLGFPLGDRWRGELGGFFESRDRDPAAGARPENRTGAGLGLRRRWPNTLLEGYARYGYVQDAAYVPDQTNHVLSVALQLAYEFH